MCDLDNRQYNYRYTNLGQPITNQCLILFRCKKIALTIKVKQNMVRSKFLNNFWSQIIIHVTGSPLNDEFLGIILSHFTFILLSSLKMKCPAPTS